MIRPPIARAWFAAFALALAVVLGIGVVPGAALAQENPVLVGRVVKVTDGDTIKVRLSSGPIDVRFDSIDAPERNQPWGRESTRALARLVAEREVELDVISQDRYGRLVAQVYVAGVNVNEQMVKGGHAWAFREYLKRANGPRYCAWEAEARVARRGLWSLGQDDWVYPSDWRRRERGTTTRRTDFGDETVADCVAAVGKR